MGSYVHFTDEQKHRANNVDLVDFLSRQGEKLIASGREKRLVSDHSITVRGNEWYDHAVEKGGYAIDFVRQFYNLTFPEAVTMLLGGQQGQSYQPADQKKPEPKKPFALPTAHTDMRRVYAYLVKSRLIDREVVSFFAKQKLLYESCEKYYDLFSDKLIQCGRARSKFKDWNEDIKAAHGLTAIPAEPHPQHLIRDAVCSELRNALRSDKTDCSADILSAELLNVRRHLHAGSFAESEDSLKDMLCRSVSAAAKAYHQAGHCRNLDTVQARLFHGCKTYENRGQFQTRLNVLEQDIMSLRGFDRVLTAAEKERLAEHYESIATHCLKAVILVEQHQQKQEQRQCQVMAMG
ncbi:DUF3991 domain-containing protein [Anaerotruncus rubiinfantis]|uniref:DUF3991 domain-containing protein n=1 Tax=Anaerotruncus rubiinfantis TaxID=1720200 RepID=UPI000831483F|nr:DUF3991 domain-containing protein [Anaerotruncus rubiinfantis]